MHINDETGHEHIHTHEHVHPDGTVHTHDHAHTHSHAHGSAEGHTHEHVHPDGTVHTHTHADGTVHTHTHADGTTHTHSHEAPADMAHLKAILKYMVEHNEHHAEELADLLGMLPEEPAAKLRRAIGSFEAANTELQMVLESLE